MIFHFSDDKANQDNNTNTSPKASHFQNQNLFSSQTCPLGQTSTIYA
jgi:hypothetical protein